MVAGMLDRFRAVANVRRIAVAPLSSQQAWLWRSTEPLFTNTVRVNPSSYLGSFCVGDELMRAGRLDEAIAWLERSLAVKPDHLDTVLTLGMAFTHKGDAGKAI